MDPINEHQLKIYYAAASLLKKEAAESHKKQAGPRGYKSINFPAPHLWEQISPSPDSIKKVKRYIEENEPLDLSKLTEGPFAVPSSDDSNLIDPQLPLSLNDFYEACKTLDKEVGFWNCTEFSRRTAEATTTTEEPSPEATKAVKEYIQDGKPLKIKMP